LLFLVISSAFLISFLSFSESIPNLELNSPCYHGV
jgi:hypothetical protein